MPVDASGSALATMGRDDTRFYVVANVSRRAKLSIYQPGRLTLTDYNHLHYITANVYRRARVFDSHFKLNFVHPPRGTEIVGHILMPAQCDLPVAERPRQVPGLENYSIPDAALTGNP